MTKRRPIIRKRKDPERSSSFMAMLKSWSGYAAAAVAIAFLIISFGGILQRGVRTQDYFFPTQQQPASEDEGTLRPGTLSGPMPPSPEAVLPPLPPWEMGRLASELDLSEQQRERIKALAEQHGTQIRSQTEQLPPLYRELEQVMLVSEPETARAKQLLRQIYTLRTNVAEVGVDFWAQIRSELTEEQNQKLTDRLRIRMKWRRDPGAFGFGPPDKPDRPAGTQDRPGSPSEPDPGL